MKTISIILTDSQYKALAVECQDPEEYLQSYATVRCDKAVKSIVQKEVEKRMESGEPIPSNRDEIVLSDSVKTAKELGDEQEEM